MISLVTLGALAAGVLSGTFLSTLGEYVMHRAMHLRTVLGRRHARHHRWGFGQGWLGELYDYAQGGVPLGAALALLMAGPFGAPALGVGFFAGVALHLAFAAYAHQLQHERPELVRWMRKPVHFLHHDGHLWRTNFGITTAFWDHVFGTYEDLPFDRPVPRVTLAELLRIDWGSPPKLDRHRRLAWEKEARARARALREERQARSGRVVAPGARTRLT